MKRCNTCGGMLDDSSVYCNICGTKLEYIQATNQRVYNGYPNQQAQNVGKQYGSNPFMEQQEIRNIPSVQQQMSGGMTSVQQQMNGNGIYMQQQTANERNIPYAQQPQYIYMPTTQNNIVLINRFSIAAAIICFLSLFTSVIEDENIIKIASACSKLYHWADGGEKVALIMVMLMPWMIGGLVVSLTISAFTRKLIGANRTLLIFHFLGFICMYKALKASWALEFSDVGIGFWFLIIGFIMSVFSNCTYTDINRTTTRVAYFCSLGEVQKMVSNILNGKGFVPIITKTGENVWKKGAGLLTAMQYIKIEFLQNEIILSAWIGIGVGNIYTEWKLEGILGALPKKQLLDVIGEIKRVLSFRK